MVVAQSQAYSVDPYCILGLRRNVERQELEETYNRLVEAFDEANFLHSPQGWVQAAQALLEIEHAYERIRNNEIEELNHEPEPFWPKLGQILVAAGKITLDDLRLIIEEQTITGKRLGRILIEKSLLNQQELEIFLASQGTIKLPDNSQYYFAQRLIGLGVIPEDMVGAALIEHCQNQKHIGEILVERGWLSEDVLCILIG